LGCNIAYTKINNEITNYNVTHGLKFLDIIHIIIINIIIVTLYVELFIKYSINILNIQNIYILNTFNNK